MSTAPKPTLTCAAATVDTGRVSFGAGWKHIAATSAPKIRGA